MQPNITQQDIDIFSSDPLGVKEQPPSPNYEDGVEVGYTAPAKWWNWFWNMLFTWCTASKADRINVHAELLSTLSKASLSPQSTEEHQLSYAVDVIEQNYCNYYNNKEVTETIDGVSVTHKVNQPDVVRHTLNLPAMELL